MLEGWPTVTLQELAPAFVSSDVFRSAVNGDISIDGNVVVTHTSLGGSANARILESVPPNDKQCADFLRRFCSYNHHLWERQSFILIDSPCYLIVETGVVILEDHRILADSIYPSTGERTIERLIGSGASISNLADLLEDADTISFGTWAPFFCRWSNVYFHAVGESLVQHFAFERNGFSPSLSYAIPSKLRGCQVLLASQLNANPLEFEKPIIKVPRLVLSTLLYNHSIMGNDFLAFATHHKARIALERPKAPKGAERLYVSREGSSARPMSNEAELADALAALGFRKVVGDSLSFDEQILAFKDANVIVGPHGAGLTNAAFARPNATIIELRPLNRQGESPMWGMSYLNLSSIMGYKYVAHVSTNESDAEIWEANLSEILPLVKKIIL